jgi:hypothetical protein
MAAGFKIRGKLGWTIAGAGIQVIAEHSGFQLKPRSEYI